MRTPGEHNRWDMQSNQTAPILTERLHQSLVHSRPSRHWIAFFLSPTPDWWSMEDFIMGHETVDFVPNTPRGRLSTMDDRRNVAIPPAVSYGSQIGDMDGVSPNGLD